MCKQIVTTKDNNQVLAIKTTYDITGLSYSQEATVSSKAILNSKLLRANVPLKK